MLPTLGASPSLSSPPLPTPQVRDMRGDSNILQNDRYTFTANNLQTTPAHKHTHTHSNTSWKLRKFLEEVPQAEPSERDLPNSAPVMSAALLSCFCPWCRCRPAQRTAPDLMRTACTVRGCLGAVSVSAALDFVFRERHECDSILYCRACPKHRSGSRAGGGLQSTE